MTKNNKVDKATGQATIYRTLSSGVEVEITPFPPGLPEKIQAKALKDFPDPKSPEIEIETFGDNETIKDLPDEEYLAYAESFELELEELEDKDEIKKLKNLIETIHQYLADKKTAKQKRDSRLGEAVLDISVHVDLKKYESKIRTLEKHLGEFPEDEEERELYFLQTYALATTKDYQDVMFDAIESAVVTDNEVANRLESFRYKMERNTNSATQT